MDRFQVEAAIKDIILMVISGRDIELVDYTFRQEGSDMVLKILVDLPQGGINLDDCAYINKEVGRIIEEKNIIAAPFTLEVSSPGLDRPLKSRNDFVRSIKRNAHFFLTEKVADKIEMDGEIVQVTDATVIVMSAGEPVAIPLDKIIKAKPII